MQILNLILLSLILRGLGLATASANGSAVIYYVAPTESFCHDDKLPNPCHSLDTYVNNKTEFFTQGSNITMNFSNGTHIVNGSGVELEVNVSSLKMTGERLGVLIEATPSHYASWFIQGKSFHMENLNISRLKFNISVDTLNIISLKFRSSVVLNILQISLNSKVSINDTDFVNHSRIIINGNKTSLSSELSGCTFQNNSYLKVIGIGILSISQTQFINVSDWSNFSPLLTSYYSGVVLTDVSFERGHQIALLAYVSDITFHGSVNFTDNRGYRGGALSLFSTALYIDNAASLYFVNNSAIDVGGAIYLNEDIILTPDRDHGDIHCFYQVLQATKSDSYVFNFKNSSANHGGVDIYGTSLSSSCLVSSGGSYRLNASEHFNLSSNNNLSSVSSDPSRICVCDVNGRPQCADKLSNIFMNRTVYPGETLTLSVVLVGGDFGATVGAVHAGFLAPNYLNISKSQSSQEIIHPACTDLEYTVYANENTSNVMYLSPYIFGSIDQVKLYFESRYDMERHISLYHDEKNILFDLLTTPVFINITTRPCPPGFRLKNSQCDCDTRLSDISDDLKCVVMDENATMQWSGGLWIGVDNDTDKVEYGAFCWYCDEHIFKTINVLSTTGLDVQCQSNRVGTLCGKCRDEYSLAIGSSRCIPCSNNNNMTLVIVFAAAGFLLIFIISVLNLTVSQGMINGLVFYANIVWAYQRTFLPNKDIPFIETFIAWLNLDFGIETCFIKYLNALGKTWLQFVFPIYTAGLFFIGLRFSKKLCSLFGDRSVPTLATLLFLSHSDLLKNIVEAIGLTQITYITYGNSTGSRIVWSVDGNIAYGSSWHIILVLVALMCFFLLWLPYTVILVYMQWLRKLPNSKLSKWITRYKPFFDSYYAPYKDNHHYWFGVLLIVQGILLIISSLVIHIDRLTSLFLILVLVIVLLFYMNLMQVYQNTSVLVTESLFFINLILLIGGLMYFDVDNKTIVVTVSVSFACLQLCGIIIWSIVWTYCSKHRLLRGRYVSIGDSSSQKSLDSKVNYVPYRDSILNDSEFQANEAELSSQSY